MKHVRTVDTNKEHLELMLRAIEDTGGEVMDVVKFNVLTFINYTHERDIDRLIMNRYNELFLDVFKVPKTKLKVSSISKQDKYKKGRLRKRSKFV